MTMISRIKEIFQRTPEAPDLDRALDSWRQECPAPERLNDATRQRILATVGSSQTESGRLAPLASLFVPAGRAAVAAIVPVLLVGMTVALVLVALPRSEFASALEVQAHKVDGEVVFVIANGGRPHRVFRSESPAAGADASEVRAEKGIFRDRIGGDADLVFYRID